MTATLDPDPLRLVATQPHPSAPPVGRVLVVIPTYDEAETIVAAITGIRRSLPDADVLVVDDGSPDGTAEIAGETGLALGHVRVLERAAKHGLGAAYRAGFAYGLRQGYDVLVQMDADGSHDPAALPALLEPLRRGADLVIGSRYVPGAAIPDWQQHRRMLSKYGNAYAATVLDLPARDVTSGFRAIRADALHAIRVDDTDATGYAFQIELAYRIALAGGYVAEVPITFTDRTVGVSKMSARIAIEALTLVTWWGLRDRVLDRRARLG